MPEGSWDDTKGSQCVWSVECFAHEWKSQAICRDDKCPEMMNGCVQVKND